MKAKNLFLLSVALFATAGAVTLTNTSQNAVTPSVKRASNWSDFVEGDHDYGSSYVIPTMTYTINGTAYPASVIVTFPDGSQSAETTITLDQAGLHTFEYSVNVGGKIHNIAKQINVGFPQVYVGDTEKSSIEYISAEKSKELGAAGTAGLYVKLGLGDTLKFTKPIYLDEMTDANALVRGYIAPLNKGSVDFNQFFIKLTDADDPEKFLILCYYSHVETNANGTTSHSSSVMVRSDAQPYFAGWHQSQGLHTNDTWGTWSGVSFDGYMKDKNNYKDAIDEAKFVFGFDHSSKTAYGTGFGRGATLDTVLDLDDTTQVSSPWSGFTSNRAFMSIYAESYSSSTANFVISDIYGVSADELKNNSFVDSEEPEITIDGDYGSLTKAVVGYFYPVPKVTAYDQVSMGCDVKTEVFYNYFSSDKTNVKITDGEFYMDKQGTYTICYTAYDKAGNKAQKLHTISVFDSLDEPSFELPAHESELHVGDFVEINKKIETSGGIGKKTVEAYYEVGGIRQPIDGNGFRITELKDYKVIYQVTDMIGQMAEKEYDIAVTDGKKPILEKTIAFPRYFISGGYYDFPTEKVYFYEDGELKEKALTLEVTDANGTNEYSGEQYSPVVTNNGEKVTVKAKCGDVLFQTSEIYTVKNMGTEQSARSINLSNYFVSKGLNKELTSDNGILLTVSDASYAGFDFATPLLLDSFTLEIKSLLDFKSNGGVTIRLSDYTNDANEIEASLYLKNEVTYFKIGDKEIALTGNDINVGNNDYAISYEDGVFTCGSSSLSVETFANGEAFTGFESMKAYLTLEFLNPQIGSRLNLINFCQSGFSSKTARDRVSPVIQMNDNYGGTKDINTTYRIDPAYAFDVFSPNTTFTLDVVSPSGQYMTAKDGTLLKDADPSKGYDIDLNEYGQYYFTLVAVEDSRFLANGTELTIGYYINVYDDVFPTVVFETGMQSEAKVGETVLLPKFSASDNLTAKEDLIIQRIMLSPNGVYHYLDDSYTAYTFKEAGEYRYIIHVIDEIGNIYTKTFVANVTE